MNNILSDYFYKMTTFIKCIKAEDARSKKKMFFIQQEKNKQLIVSHFNILYFVDEVDVYRQGMHLIY